MSRNPEIKEFPNGSILSTFSDLEKPKELLKLKLHLAAHTSAQRVRKPKPREPRPQEQRMKVIRGLLRLHFLAVKPTLIQYARLMDANPIDFPKCFRAKGGPKNYKQAVTMPKYERQGKAVQSELDRAWNGL